MYIVVSKWSFRPDQREAFVDAARKSRDAMRHVPGVEMVEGLTPGESSGVAIVGYKDEATYHSIMAEGGPFENIGTWEWSERGEAMDREPAKA
jgi:hypothetical protein